MGLVKTKRALRRRVSGLWKELRQNRRLQAVERLTIFVGMEQLEPRTLLTAAISFLPQEGIGTITQEGPNTVLTLNPGITSASFSVNVASTDVSPFDFQLDLRASELGEGKLSLSSWVTASGFSPQDEALGPNDTIIRGAVSDPTSIGSFTVSIPTAPGDYLLSPLASPIYSGELFYTRFINRIEETIEAFNSAINVTAIRDFNGNSVVVQNQDYPNIFKVAYTYDSLTKGLTYGPSQQIAQSLGADGIVSTPDGQFVIVGGQTSELFKVPVNGGEIETALLDLAGGFHMTLDPAGDRVWTSNEPGTHLAEVPIANFGSGIVEHLVSGDDTTLNKIAFAPALTQLGNLAYYANSDRDGGLTGGDGHFGIIDLDSFVTSRKFINLPAAHSIAYDPYTGDLLLFGARSIVQVDISDPMNPQIRSTLDLTAELNAIAQNVRVDGTLAGFPVSNFNTNVPLNVIDHSIVDGFGHALAAVNTGHFIFLDYAGNSPAESLIANGTVFLAQDNKLPFLDTFFEGFSPVIDSSSNGGTILTTDGGTLPLSQTGNLIIRVLSQSEQPVVTIVATTPEASEQGPVAGILTVSRTGDTDTELTVFYTIGGTASTDGSDYAPLSGSVTIPAGESSATITITPIDDDDAEGTESVIITLSGSESYAIGDQSQANVTIEDNDQAPELPVVSIIDSLSFSEASLNGVFYISRTGSTTESLSVFYTVGGTATPGEDYAALTGVLVIPAGSKDVPINVFPMDDDLVEGDETIELTITTNEAYTIGIGQLTITLADDDEPITLPTVEIIASDPDAAELGSDPGEFTITRTGPNTEPLIVAFSLGGTAALGTDYTGVPLQATIPAGQSSVTITVVPINDLDTSEDDETVILTVIDHNNSYLIGSDASATVTIANNNVPSTASIFGIVYNDANLNGSPDLGETGVQLALVYIDANNNGVFDQEEQRVLTNNTGTFQFGSLPPGTYTVRIQLPSGRTLTDPLSGSHIVTLGVGETANRNFGTRTGGTSTGLTNLTIAFNPALALPDRLVPGDKLALSGTISNTGGTAVTGNVVIGLFLVPVGLDVTDPASTLLGTVNVKGSALKAGSTVNWSTSKAVVPASVAEGDYYLVAVADIQNAVPETSKNDNIAIRDGLTVGLNFGEVPGRTSIVKSLKVGGITYTIAGPGAGQIVAGINGQPDSLVVNGATGKTTISAKADKGVEPRILDVTINGSANALNLKGFDLVGSINVTGTLKTLTLGNVADQHNIVIGTPEEGDKSTLAFTAASVRNLSLASGMPIKSIKVTDWIDDDATPDVITAPSIASIASTGDFHAAIIVTSNSTLVPLGKVTVKGTLLSLIRSAGNIGAVTAGNMVNSRIFAGVVDSVTGLPSAPSDFTPGSNALIGKVTVSGVKGETGATFINSLIAAPNVGAVSLKAVQTANSGVAIGVAADNLIKSLKIAGGLSVSNVTAVGDQSVEDFRVRIV